MSHGANAGTVGAIVSIFFFLFLTISAVAGIIYDYRKRRLQVEALRIAVEHGERLDPALMERLIAQHRERPSNDTRLIPHYMQIGGIITTAAGIGIALLSFFIGHVAPITLYPILGAGIVVVCVGLGLLVAARAMKRGGAFDDPADRAA
ncbi:MAG TPA: DUF6249 domain-containing protein [Steroidobacteraceae bacterium]|nr:DUF6249 domain-containing protein [Steroidobacteraceae bacterium]